VERNIEKNYCPFYVYYVLYIGEFQQKLRILDKLNKNVKYLEFTYKLLAKQKSESMKTFSIDGFLVMPVQRLNQYSHLIEDILKELPKDHVDYAGLKTTTDNIQKISNIASLKADEVSVNRSPHSAVHLRKQSVPF